MLPRNSKIAAIVIALLILGGAVAFWTSNRSPAAKETVEKFYFMWTDSSIHPLIERSYHGSPYLTREQIRRLDRQGRGFAEGALDPVTCMKRMPEGYSISFSSGDTERPTLRVRTDGEDGTTADVTVEVEKQKDGTWLIDSITCPVAEEPAPTPAV